jgi:tetratricopeptide (TPR) repeat protein
MKKIVCAVALLGVVVLGVLPASAQDDAMNEEQHSHAAPVGDANLADYFWRQSDEAFHAGDYPRAIELHRAIVAYDPGDVESYSVAAWLLWSLGKKEEARAHIQRGLNANPYNWLMWDAAGQHYDLQKRTAPELAPQAVAAYARAVQLLPRSADQNDAQMLRRRLAHAAEKANDLNLSLSTWRDLVRDFPDDAVNKNNLARVAKLNAEKQRGAFLPVATGALAVLFVGAWHAMPKT